MARLSTEINGGGGGSCAATMLGESSTTEDGGGGGEDSRGESNATTNPSSVASSSSSSSSVKSEEEENRNERVEGAQVNRKNHHQQKKAKSTPKSSLSSPPKASNKNEDHHPEYEDERLLHSSPSLDPEVYEQLEFTPAATEAIVALLNGLMPELPEALEAPLQSNTANLYFRLGCLAQFFNAMFAVPELLYLKDLPPMPSAPRHMNEARIDTVHRYIRFWLGQFYACDDVIGECLLYFYFFIF